VRGGNILRLINTRDHAWLLMDSKKYIYRLLPSISSTGVHLDFMDYRYSVNQYEKQYIYSGRRRGEREIERERNYRVLSIYIIPKVSNIPLIEPILYPILNPLILVYIVKTRLFYIVLDYTNKLGKTLN
jgi:hypothetical protein